VKRQNGAYGPLYGPAAQMAVAAAADHQGDLASYAEQLFNFDGCRLVAYWAGSYGPAAKAEQIRTTVGHSFLPAL
jgi:hypothetical protein